MSSGWSTALFGAVAATRAAERRQLARLLTLWDTALLTGLGGGGLLAARVLADFFRTVTVVERDVLPDDHANRRGVPQGRHAHLLLPRGAQILDELFPGILDGLVADGAPVLDDGELSRFHFSFGGHEMLRSGKSAFDPKAMATYVPSRPFLEGHAPAAPTNHRQRDDPGGP